MQEVVFEKSKAKIIVLLLFSVVFVLLGIWILSGGADDARRSLGVVGNRIVGIAGILFFGGIGLILIKKILEKEPGLVLNKDGFIDNSSALSAGFVPWSNVKMLGLLSFSGQQFIAIKLHDARDFLERGNAIQKMLKRKNLKMTEADILISANILPINAEDLLKQFEEYLQVYLKK